MGALKTISIGDIHGNDIWTQIEPDDFDKIIFIGDYTDSFVYPDIHILENLEHIIKFKLNYPDKVVLLLGNHDLQYMFTYKDFGCTGYRGGMYPILNDLFTEHAELFQAAFEIKSGEFTYLWTHAGVHTGWYFQKFLPTFKGTVLEELSLGEQINEEFSKLNSTLFHVGHLRGGYQTVGGPFWADKRMTSSKPIKFYHQIVGHTRVEKIEQIDFDLYRSITFIDCLESDKDDFYILDIYE